MDVVSSTKRSCTVVGSYSFLIHHHITLHVRKLINKLWTYANSTFKLRNNSRYTYKVIFLFCYNRIVINHFSNLVSIYVKKYKVFRRFLINTTTLRVHYLTLQQWMYHSKMFHMFSTLKNLKTKNNHSSYFYATWNKRNEYKI